MSKYNNYHSVKVGKISQKKLKNAARGAAVNLTKDELNGNNSLLVHPENARKILNAQKKQTGVRLHFTPGEIQNDMEYHSTMQGGSLWDVVKGGLKWLGTQALNGIADGAKEVVGPGFAPVVDYARNGVKSVTGLGLGGKVAKGSQAAKDRMSKLRSMRKNVSGKGFRLS